MLAYLNYYVFRWLRFRIIRVRNQYYEPIGIGLIFVTPESGWGDEPFVHLRNPIFLIYGARAMGGEVNAEEQMGEME